ncbi:hypothetical protein [Jannaschia sp. CCS1]|uniref:hypothetical protein n=1 Tax=Jannaschia sp. (strain CCS1) TaxID=290400 RepID=UPI000053A80E|nr:hypothetical protein [Jannaschia sp. CCS1]ABD53723.1 hypothetical protein Jann_0806 [Jannaschia sp. CCS1]
MPRPPLLALIPALLAVVSVSACGLSQPPTRATAERLCQQEAREADGISGSVGIGGGSNGPFARSDISINSNILNPRSEEDALHACVARRMGGQPNPSGGGLTVGLSLRGTP